MKDDTGYKLFLDDYRKPYSSDWVWVKDYREFKNCIIKNGLPKAISLDHDLCVEHYREYDRCKGRDFDYGRISIPTGLHCSAYLIDRLNRDIDVIIHSANRIGARNIKNRFLFYGMTSDNKVNIRTVDYNEDFEIIKLEYAQKEKEKKSQN